MQDKFPRLSGLERPKGAEGRSSILGEEKPVQSGDDPVTGAAV